MIFTSFLADRSASIDAGTDFARREICPELCSTDPVDIASSFWTPSNSSISLSFS